MNCIVGDKLEPWLTSGVYLEAYMRYITLNMTKKRPKRPIFCLGQDREAPKVPKAPDVR